MKAFFLGLFLALIQVQCLFAWGDNRLFAKYPNRYFVESGTYYGAGIQHAITAGFPEIYSIELDPLFYEMGLKTFKDTKQVHLIFGDSGKLLFDVIKDFNEPITFWLDGHYVGREEGRGDSNAPILQELEWIKHHHIKNHTIMIDDARLFGTESFDFVTTFQIILKLQEINPEYEIKYEHGYIHHDILVAYPPK